VSETTVAPERTEAEQGQEQERWLGKNVPRKEDKRLVQGEGVFFDDVKRHNMGYIHFVRSPYAHAKIRSVDVSAALEHPGVYGTLTGDEVATLTDPFFQISSPPGAHLKDYCLAVGKVRFVGEPVAAVVAETRCVSPAQPFSAGDAARRPAPARSERRFRSGMQGSRSVGMKRTDRWRGAPPCVWGRGSERGDRDARWLGQTWDTPRGACPPRRHP
jgi:hypothetical protein